MKLDRKKRAIIAVGVFLLGLAIIAVSSNSEQDDETYQQPLPEDIVRQYFTAWDKKDYVNMHATFSDGFKKIETTAKDLASFQRYAASQDIEGVRINSIKEQANDGTTATVAYSVEFTLRDDSKRLFEGAFTLKHRKGDVIQGWKLIHPYGEKIDAT